MRQIIEQGYVYIAQPPLYKVQQGKRVEYAYNDQQLEEILKSFRKILSQACSATKVWAR